MSWGWIFLVTWIVWTLWAAYHFKCWFVEQGHNILWFGWPLVFLCMYIYAPYSLWWDIKGYKKRKEWKK